ncbi:MAG: AMP-binding protein [Spirochaetales bacterium]|nr:AMP-binding protein [Spirochaetales bacterium]
MYKNLLEIPFNTAQKYPDRVSHRFREGKSFTDITYSRFVQDIKILTEGFAAYGIQEGDHAAFFVNNRYEWTLVDHALMAISAVSVPRGSDTSPMEAVFIFNHSDSKWAVLENIAQYKELLTVSESFREDCEKIFIIDRCDGFEDPENKIVFFDDLYARGEEVLREDPSAFDAHYKAVSADNLLTIIYTSGTTGNPKGVMLSHIQFLQQVKMVIPRLMIDEKAGEVTVTILPAWHVFERAFEYVGLSAGISFVYSSLKHFSVDILREKPHFLVTVPRVWDSIHSKMRKHMRTQSPAKRGIFNFFVAVNMRYKTRKSYFNRTFISYEDEDAFQKVSRSIGYALSMAVTYPLHRMAEIMFKAVRAKVGGRLRMAISGGGSLPPAVDDFFASVGITVMNSYGMTESAPGITSRALGRNTLGSVGIPFVDTEVKILDDKGREVSVGEKGTLYARGPQIMSGYYKNKEATEKVLSEDGWLCTGDLAKKTVYGDYVLVGRNKDTIILFGGENVDPNPIEDKIQESELIDHVMVLGQDRKGLTAFIAINEEELSRIAESIKVKIGNVFDHISEPTELRSKEVSEAYKSLQEWIKLDLNKKITRKSGFKPFETISDVIIVKNTFMIGEELTQTLKIKRQSINDKYQQIIRHFMGKA